MIYKLYPVQRTIHEKAYEENGRTYYKLSSWIDIRAFLKSECDF